MQIYKNKSLWVFWVCCLTTTLIFAEQTDKLRLIHADKLEQYTQQGALIKKLTGDVFFRKGDTELTCELAYWYEQEERVEFFKNVKVTQTEQTILADTLIYYSDKEIIEARGHPRIEEADRSIRARKIIYFVETKKSEATGDVILEEPNQVLKAQALTYFARQKKSIATQRAELFDAQENTRLKADSIIYFNQTEEINAFQSPVLIHYDSTGQTANQIAGKYIHGNQLSGDFTVLDSVRMQRENFIAHAEQSIYDDSLQTLTLKGDPRVINGQRVITGEWMTAYLKNNKIEALYVFEGSRATATGKAYLPPDSVTTGHSQPPREEIPIRDELSGKSMHIFFQKGQADTMLVMGMATSYYNVLEDSIIKGVNTASGDTIIMDLDQGELVSITVIGGTQGKFIPHRTNTSVDTTIIYSAERIVYQVQKKITNLYQNASTKSGNMKLTAGKISVHWEENLMYAYPLQTGIRDSSATNIPTFYQKDREPFSGEEMVYNLQTRKGRIVEGATKVEDGFYYGENISKAGKRTYYVEQGIYTTCDIPDTPHYYFKSQQMKLIQKDKIIARPLIFYIHDIPLLGIPFAVLPDQGGKRHSGWIMPSYGDNSNVGGNLRGLGYFWVINDYADLRITGDFFDKVGVRANLRTRYKKRYKFNGSVNGSYDNTFLAERPKKVWRLNVNHSQNISPTSRLRINGRFVSNDRYYTKNGMDLSTRLNQQLISNATYSKNWRDKPYSLSMNLNQTINLQAKKQIKSPPSIANKKANYIQRSLPNISLSRSSRRLIPLKSGQAATQSKWYNNIYFRVSSRLRNKQNIYYTSVAEADSFLWQQENELNNALTHDISLTASQKVFSVITLNENLSIDEGWINRYEMPRDSSGNFIINEKGQLETVTVHGFKARHTGSISLNAQTKLYGLFPIRLGSLQAVRHVVTPSVGFRYRPDFTQDIFGWEPGYILSGQDITGKKWNYDPFQQTMLGATPSRDQRSMTFSLGNIFQAKTITEEEEKKLDLFTLNFSSNYNFAADSLRMAPLRTSFRTQVTRQMALNLSATHNWYAQQNGRQINQWYREWQGVPLPRLTALSASTGFKVKGNRFGAVRETPAFSDTADTSAGAEDILTPDYRQDIDRGSTPRREEGNQLWSASFNFRYSLNQYTSDNRSERFFMSMNLNLKLTQKWQLGYRASVDLLKKKIVSQNISIDRDLHCWQLSFNWVPTGYGKQYNLIIRIKSSALRDIKYEERGGRRRGPYY